MVTKVFQNPSKEELRYGQKDEIGQEDSAARSPLSLPLLPILPHTNAKLLANRSFKEFEIFYPQ